MRWLPQGIARRQLSWNSSPGLQIFTASSGLCAWGKLQTDKRINGKRPDTKIRATITGESRQLRGPGNSWKETRLRAVPESRHLETDREEHSKSLRVFSGEPKPYTAAKRGVQGASLFAGHSRKNPTDLDTRLAKLLGLPRTEVVAGIRNFPS